MKKLVDMVPVRDYCQNMVLSADEARTLRQNVRNMYCVCNLQELESALIHHKENPTMRGNEETIAFIQELIDECNLDLSGRIIRYVDYTVLSELLSHTMRMQRMLFGDSFMTEQELRGALSDPYVYCEDYLQSALENMFLHHVRVGGRERQTKFSDIHIDHTKQIVTIWLAIK